MSSFEGQASGLVATVAGLFQHTGADREYRLLKGARATLLHTAHDNWDGGVELYTLVLDVPLEMFAAIEDRQDEIETAILHRLKKLLRIESANAITEVVITPALTADSRPKFDSPSADEAAETDSPPSLWPAGYFRLFLSHVSTVKDKTYLLREALKAYSISGFVAHADIEPGKEWQSEIESALRTMDALVAIITPDFVDSRWCDQEVGIAIGRDKLVVPVRAGADPHGFMGKFQGLQAKGSQATVVAEQISDILARHERSYARLAEVLVARLEKSRSWDGARGTTKLLEKLTKIPPGLLPRLASASLINDEVKEAWTVSGRLASLIERHSTGPA